MTVSLQICALDATHIDDGKKVILKRLLNDGHELGIIKYLYAPSSFLVMPYCRRSNYPPFHSRNEFLEAMNQFLEGLQFMHEHNIVHFDIAPQNMMMDETRAIPKGSHFSNPRTHTGFYDLFSWNDRCTVGPVDYYYIDFGLSLYFPDGEDAALYVGTLRTFPTIPELSQTVPYNPFKVDIFQLGLTIHNLIDAYPDLEEFRPVAENMTAKNPNDRPNPLDASTQLRGIATAMPPFKRSEQIWEKDTGVWKKASRLLGGYRYDYRRTPFSVRMPHVRDTRPLPKRRKLNPAVLLTTPTAAQPSEEPEARRRRVRLVPPRPSCRRFLRTVRRRDVRDLRAEVHVDGHTRARAEPLPAPTRSRQHEHEHGDEWTRQREYEGDAEERVEDGSGCGRTVCRACCFETPQESTTCYDCEAI
ncbi:kinase-like domain-containing protein [Mycena vulgaris]|nr:kinase-like domain-containing protein [Mycena vulgaris]